MTRCRRVGDKAVVSTIDLIATGPGANTVYLVDGTTTLYAGGNGDTLIGSGGDATTLDNWSGSQTISGEYSTGLDTFNFNAANVSATCRATPPGPPQRHSPARPPTRAAKSCILRVERTSPSWASPG